MKTKNYLLITIVILILNIVLVHFGRIYYPLNFHPNEITFFENYWVLTLGMILCIIEAAAFLGILYFVFFMIIPEVINDIKKLFS